VKARQPKTLAQLRRRLPKDFKPLLDAAATAGADLREKKNGVVIVTPDGTVMLHGTPSVHRRALENTRAELRQLGIEVQ
jgi:hypothetical protein